MTDSDSTKKLQVFISHASEDNATAKRLSRRLKEDGFDPWLDDERLLPGQDWKLECEKALDSSDAVLICFSEESVSKSGFVQKEFKQAMEKQKEKPDGMIFAIPVRLGNCKVPYSFQRLQWMDYPDGYDRLVLALQSKTAGTTTPPPAAPRKQPAAPRTSSRGSNGKPPAPKPSGGNIFNIQGDVHFGGGMVNIAGDQFNLHQETILNISTPAQFADELQKLKAEIGQLKAQANIDPAAARRLDVVQGDIQDAIEESSKEKPVAERIKTTLDGAKETMEKLGGSIGAAVSLGTTIGNLALMAWKLFGGG